MKKEHSSHFNKLRGMFSILAKKKGNLIESLSRENAISVFPIGDSVNACTYRDFALIGVAISEV